MVPRLIRASAACLGALALSGQAVAGEAPPSPEEVAAMKFPPRTFTVYFSSGSAELTREAEAGVLEAKIYSEGQTSGVLARYITIVGYADTAGPADLNMTLSEARAQAVVNGLFLIGAPLENMDMEWKGEGDLAVGTPDNVDERRNRRVTIHIRF